MRPGKLHVGAFIYGQSIYGSKSTRLGEDLHGAMWFKDGSDRAGSSCRDWRVGDEPDDPSLALRGGNSDSVNPPIVPTFSTEYGYLIASWGKRIEPG